MRLLYTSLFHLLVPIVLLRLYWRGFKAPEYRKRWTERLGIYTKEYPQNVIWIHAVSVGEAEAVFPLVKLLQKQNPLEQFLITTTTPTGSARVQAVLSDKVSHVYLPYDLPFVVARFLGVFKPKIAIIMEKEIWPNLYAQCAENHIPLIIINARLSANSAKGYKKIPTLVKPALLNVKSIATQTKDDEKRFIEIGANPKITHTLGNLKFDLSIDEETIQKAKQIKQTIFAGRFVWIIASTHDGEEQLFFDLYPQLKQQIPELLLMVVPRHPERFNTVKILAEKMQLKTCLRSSSVSCNESIDVYIADTMGELKCLYGAADICFVGGSMVSVGGHNILEPAAMNVPIMFGPFMVNFKDIAKNVLDLGAAVQCADKQALSETAIHLYNSPEYRQEITDKAAKFVKSNQGAVTRMAALMTDILNKNKEDSTSIMSHNSDKH